MQMRRAARLYTHVKQGPNKARLSIRQHRLTIRVHYTGSLYLHGILIVYVSLLIHIDRVHWHAEAY